MKCLICRKRINAENEFCPFCGVRLPSNENEHFDLNAAAKNGLLYAFIRKAGRKRILGYFYLLLLMGIYLYQFLHETFFTYLEVTYAIVFTLVLAYLICRIGMDQIPALHPVFRRFSKLGNRAEICRIFDAELEKRIPIGSGNYMTPHYLFAIYHDALGVFSVDDLMWAYRGGNYSPRQIVLFNDKVNSCIMDFETPRAAKAALDILRQRLPWLLFDEYSEERSYYILNHEQETMDEVRQRKTEMEPLIP